MTRFLLMSGQTLEPWHLPLSYTFIRHYSHFRLCETGKFQSSPCFGKPTPSSTAVTSASRKNLASSEQEETRKLSIRIPASARPCWRPAQTKRRD